MKNKDFYNFLKSVYTADGMFISDKFEDMPDPMIPVQPDEQQ